MVADRAKAAEAVNDFVADEIGVVAPDFAVMVIVVPAAILDVGSQGSRQLLRLVFREKVHHMIGDKRGKPADVLARGLQVVGRPDRSGGHDYHIAEVAAGLLGDYANEKQTPFDESGIDELQNH